MPYDVFSRFLPENPHIRFFESRERGYFLAQATRSLWRTELRIVNTITKPETTSRTLKAYAVEASKAGAQEA